MIDKLLFDFPETDNVHKNNGIGTWFLTNLQEQAKKLYTDTEGKVKMLEINQLDPTEYKDRNYIFEYQTPGYYDLLINEWTFQFVYKEFDKAEERKFEDRLLREWLEQPVLYGAFADGALGGIIEGSIENWNNRFRISNILVFEGYRNNHMGTALIEYMVVKAKEQKTRMVVLETQSCNIPAIRCYLKNGFKVIGFDTHAYSDADLENHEIRIEMGRKI